MKNVYTIFEGRRLILILLCVCVCESNNIHILRDERQASGNYAHSVLLNIPRGNMYITILNST